LNVDPITFNLPEYEDLSGKKYRKEKYRLQVELLKLQEHVLKTKTRVLIIFEGRDAAGKGSTIKRFVEHLMPKATNVVELGIPTPQQSKNWFKTWEKKIPKYGDITFFDRSWYSRAVIQPVMGYCSDAQYKYFINKVNLWEKSLCEDGKTMIVKFYLSISPERQLERLKSRANDRLKYWKLSSNDWKAFKKLKLISSYTARMFKKTSTQWAPWVVINSDNRQIARLNAMRYLLSTMDYSGKKELKKKKWTNPVSESIIIEGITFDGLSDEQYNLLYDLKHKGG